MNILQRERLEARPVSVTWQRRLRAALLAGLVLFLALGAYALVVGPGLARSS